MKTQNKSHTDRSWLDIETVIIIGLILKLMLSVVFLVWNQSGEDMILHPTPAMAAATSPTATPTASPAAGPGTKPATKPNAATPATTDTGEAPLSAEARQYLALLESLKIREAEVIRKEQYLKDRETALKTVEKEINNRLAEIEATRQKLAELVKRNEQMVERNEKLIEEQKTAIAEQKNVKAARIEHLVAAYKSMKPERAAVLVNSLDDSVAVDILSAMPGKSAGQILALVDPVKAARLTKTISERNGGVPPTADDKAEPGTEESSTTETPTAQGKPPAPSTTPPTKPAGPATPAAAPAKTPGPTTPTAPKAKTQ